MSEILATQWLNVPEWLDNIAPGAAKAARILSNDSNLIKVRRERLQRLVNAKAAWHELPRRHKSKKQLSPAELHDAQHELMVTAFYAAADFGLSPIGEREIEQSKQRLDKIAIDVATLALDISQDGRDAQLIGFWRTYQNNRPDDAVLRRLPDNLLDVAHAIDRIRDFYRLAAPLYKPQGPIRPVGQPRAHDALKTTVIKQIAAVCQKHFNTYLLSTIATLANASLNRKDIRRSTVQAALRNTG